MIISENRLREIIASVIVEHLNERGTNLGTLYHFTDMRGLFEIVRSGLFKLSDRQQDIRGGKNYMSFTRHKSPLEGFAAAATDQNPVRIEVYGEALNSIHNKSIDSFEYYSPDKARNITRCNPWKAMTPDNGNNSAKSAYVKASGKIKNKAYRYSEFLNQAEESLTSNAEFINAEKAIKRIDICTSFLSDYSDSRKQGIYSYLTKILNSKNSSLYSKIFIYNNMRDFSLQTDNCIPISEYSEEKLRVDLGLNNGGSAQRTVAEGADGSGIHIKEKNRGKFTATKERTGKSTEELTHSKNPLTRKRAIFAQNAKKWNKGK